MLIRNGPDHCLVKHSPVFVDPSERDIREFIKTQVPAELNNGLTGRRINVITRSRRMTIYVDADIQYIVSDHRTDPSRT